MPIRIRFRPGSRESRRRPDAELFRVFRLLWCVRFGCKTTLFKRLCRQQQDINTFVLSKSWGCGIATNNKSAEGITRYGLRVFPFSIRIVRNCGREKTGETQNTNYHRIVWSKATSLLGKMIGNGRRRSISKQQMPCPQQLGSNKS